MFKKILFTLFCAALFAEILAKQPLSPTYLTLKILCSAALIRSLVVWLQRHPEEQASSRVIFRAHWLS